MEKLNTLTVDNVFCSAIKCIYSKVQCSGIRLTGNFTDWFNVNTGLKQEFPLNLLLFTSYRNDLVTFIKSYNCGIDKGYDKVCIPLYTYYVVLMLANKENEL